MAQSIKKPFSFKGKLTKKKYFEGWYFKMVSKDLRHRISLIPGISLNKDDSHAFIQVIYNETKTDGTSDILTDYLRYDIGEFSYDKTSMEVKIENNTFSPFYLKLNITSKDISLKGKLEFNNYNLIKTNILSPSIMGFFAYIPLMECYHSVVSTNHNVSGTLELNNKTIDLNEGKGYIEKDYGKSFPTSYIWAQTNNFADASTSLMLSIATIPFLGLKFKGLIAVLTHQSKEYRFATYNLSKVKELTLKENSARIVLSKGKYKLVLKISIDQTRDLSSPKAGVMSQTIKEGLSGVIEVSLYHKRELIYQDKGLSAGVELMMK